ncbi:MAG TPA: hypothetical protein VFC92_00890 [Bacteroidales bacterium]|nr:hypothetical protein [Bacteroidales bacterium]
MEIAEWREIAYRKAFETTLKYIQNLRHRDKKFTIDSLEAMLQTEYDRQGLAWDGRGEVVEISIEANIAAMQQELYSWRKEI